MDERGEINYINQQVHFVGLNEGRNDAVNRLKPTSIVLNEFLCLWHFSLAHLTRRGRIVLSLSKSRAAKSMNGDKINADLKIKERNIIRCCRV